MNASNRLHFIEKQITSNAKSILLRRVRFLLMRLNYFESKKSFDELLHCYNFTTILLLLFLFRFTPF